jgi:hypothetical protein
MKIFFRLILAVVVMSLAPAMYGQATHPAYLHALSDLRAARWLLQRTPGNWARVNDELNAIRKIDDAIAEIRKSAIDDGKDINFNPKVDEKPDRPGRLHDVEAYLRKARADINQEEDNGAIQGLRGRAAMHIEAALVLVGNAVKPGPPQGAKAPATVGPAPMAPAPNTIASMRHPAYLSALADLRSARWLLQNVPGNWIRVNDELNAIRRIDDAIAEIRRAAIDDGRDINYNPGVNERFDRYGRLSDSVSFLRRARADIDRGENDGATQGLRDRAAVHIEGAILFTENAIRAGGAGRQVAPPVVIQQAAPPPAPATVSDMALSSEADWTSIIPSSGVVPVGAFKAGVDTGGGPLYIIRCSYEGGIVVGKYNPLNGKAYISYGGQEIEIADDPVEIYVGYGFWVFSRGENPPGNAIIAGYENDGSPLLIIHGKWLGNVTCGKYSMKYHMGYIPYGGREIQVSSNISFLVPDDLPDSR